MHTAVELAQAWRTEAARFRELGLEPLARLTEEHAAQVESLAVAPDVEVTVDQREAARICGVSERTVRGWVAAGRLEDVGHGRPRYRLADLPARREAGSGYDPARDAADLLARRRAS